LSAPVPRGTLVVLAALLTGRGKVLLGDLGAENFPMRSSLLVIITGLILFHLGPQILRAVSFFGSPSCS